MENLTAFITSWVPLKTALFVIKNQIKNWTTRVKHTTLKLQRDTSQTASLVDLLTGFAKRSSQTLHLNKNTLVQLKL